MTQAVALHWRIAASAWLSRVIAGAMQFLSLGLLLQHLGAEQFAAFGLLFALLGWGTLVDLGVGASVQNALSTRRATGKDAGDDLIVAAALIVLSSLVIAMLMLNWMAPTLGSAYLSNIASLDQQQQQSLFFISGLLALCAGASGVVLRVWYAEGRGHWSNFLPAIATIIGFLTLCYLGAEGKLTLKAAIFAMMCPFVLLSIVGVCIRLCEIPIQNAINRNAFHEVASRAWRFWLFALIATCVLQMDAIVISQALQATEIAAYTLASKCFGVVLILYSGLMSAIWPALAERAAQHDRVGFRKLMATSLRIGIGLSLAGALGLALFLEPVARWLSPESNLDFPATLFALFGLYMLLRVWTDIHATALQSLTILQPFWIWVPVQAALTGLTMMVLAPSWGVVGVVAGLIAGNTMTVAWALPRALRMAMDSGKSK